MTARANTRSVRSLMRQPGDKLNILTFATHERYEENLCRTGHNFYSFNYGKQWDQTYAPIPDNYHIVNRLPDWVDIDIVLSHTTCDRIQVAHDLLSGTRGGLKNIAVPVLRHCHVLPDINFDVEKEIKNYHQIPVDANCFISDFNQSQWKFSKYNSSVIPHGVDTEFWNPETPSKSETKNKIDYPPFCLNVVNYFPDRNWCCGFDLWREVTKNLPTLVKGKSSNRAFSRPAEDKDELRYYYQQARLFLNTSLHSPIPTVILEAMSCGCPIVSTETCMIPEVVEHGVNGFMSNDPEELEGYCIKLLNDPVLANKMGQAARKTIEDKYNLPKFIENWNKLLYKTIGEFRC